MDVRRAGVEALDLVEPLWAGMVEHHREVAGIPVRALADTWAQRRGEYERWLGDGSGTLFLAGGDPPAGYAMLRVGTPGATFDLGERIGDVESLSVSPDARGAGVGSALLQACREELRRQGIEWWVISVVEANEGAIRLYEREGFGSFYRTMAGRV